MAEGTRKGKRDRALIPNDNDPASVPPATVGPPAARPGDPNGVEIVDGPAPHPRIALPPPAHWSGYPAEWATAWNGWNRLEDLSDVAWACLDLNSQLLATMPPYLVAAAPTLDAAWMGNPDPDQYTAWEEFANQLFWDYQLGEAFILATARYHSGWPARFHVVAPWEVDVDYGRDGLRHYRIGGELVDGDLLHVRYRSRVGVARGRGPLEVGRARIVAANVLNRYATNLAASGGIPAGVLEHPGELTAEQSELLRDQWVQARVANMGLPAILSGGLTWRETQVDPLRMALVELAQYNESRIAILLGVPPHLMALPSGGDPMTYSNVAQQYDAHWRAYLKPRAQTVMSALSQWALPGGTRVELNRDAYVQPGPLERAQTAEIWNRIGALSIEEIRLAERFDTPTTPADPGVLA